MPLFKRRGRDEQPGDGSPPAAARILNLQEIFDRLEEEIFRAGRYGRPLVVLCVVPQRMTGAVPDPQEIAAAAEFVSSELRFSDRVGVLTDGAVVAVLPETQPDVARVIAHRLAADLAVRSAGSTRRNWLAGTSTFPEDGADPPAMVQAAIDHAHR
jgi:hypothetical protein